MKIGQQIVRYRKSLNLSQEELAEQVYVTRQSVSNWENNKTYPDIHSLLLLSQIFQVSLDTLIKGDLEEMKKQIQENDKIDFEKNALIMTSLMFLLMVSAYPLFYYLDWIGLGIFLLLFLSTMYFALRVERFKKKYDVQTYKEIVAVSNGQTLDAIEKREEKAKYPYQKTIIVIAFTIIAGLVALLSSFIFHWFIH